MGEDALGVNIAAWDGTDVGTSAASISGQLRRAGLGLLRYPGGSWADEYDWSTNSDTSTCDGSVETSCTLSDPLGFDAFAVQARAAKASMFITVNYGSSTPALAASWVAHAKSTTGNGVSLWEVGNEGYSCAEQNEPLRNPPASVPNYRPKGSVCPTTSVMAESYAAHSPPFIKAMRSASPHIKIGVPWAFTSAEAAGAGVANAPTWNTTVLQADRALINFVDAHWYPFDSVVGLSDEQIVGSIQRIPAAAQSIVAKLHRYSPQATFVVGETNISDQETTLDFKPVAALFAAATSLEWLAQGAQSAVWWDLNNFGSASAGDYGLLSTGPPEAEPSGTPLPPYYGEELASRLVTPGSQLSRLTTSSKTVVGFRSVLHGMSSILLINTNSQDPSTITADWFPDGSQLNTATYSASTAGGPTPIVHTTIRAGKTVTLPAESILVLTDH
jgi:hypothetical protein